MKVLIFGGQGFIGSHTVEELLRQGDDVTIFDRYRYFKHYSKRVAHFIGDIRDREAVMEACSIHDAAINLAGILGTMETVNNPHPSVNTNIHGALNFFDGCLPNKALKNPIPCVQITVGNHFMNNSYSISKSTAERFALMYNKERGGKISVVRGLNAYGPGQKHKPVRKITPNFIIRALNKIPIEVYGSGESVMDMIWVKDLAKILIAAVKKEHGVYDSVFSAGTGRSTTVKFIAETINSVAGSEAGLTHLPMRAGEPEQSVVIGEPDTLKPLGFGADSLVKFEDGIKETIEWYKANYDIKNI